MPINIDPILFEWNFISIRWYGIFLVIGLAIALLILVKLFKQNKLSPDLALNIGIWLIIGGLLGARLGHILFYEPSYYFKNLKEIFFINHGGLSSHGMTIGIIITFFIFIKIKKLDWRKLVDLIVIPLPIIAGFIRLGNFFNSEIIGRSTNLPWAVKFVRIETNPISRHPSQIYEALICFAIFFILYFVYKKFYKKLTPLFITMLFVFLYFSTRFLIEFTKEFQTLSPKHILTMGQYLSIPFIIFSGAWLFYKIWYNKKRI